MYSRMCFILSYGIMLIIFFISCKGNKNENDKDKNRFRYSQFDTVKFIDSCQDYVATINIKIKHLREKRHKVSGKSSEGGEIIGYFNGVELLKITSSFFGEMGRTRGEYYLKEGKLLYFCKEEILYDKPMYIKGSKEVSSHKNYYYFTTKLFLWLDNERTIVDSKNKIFNNEGENIINDVKEFSNDLISK